MLKRVARLLGFVDGDAEPENFPQYLVEQDFTDQSGSKEAKAIVYEDGNTEIPEEEWKQIELIMGLAEALHRREVDICFRCGQHIEALVQSGASTYAMPCRCRLWRGPVPPEWQ